MSSSAWFNTSQVVTNVVFGMTATVISIVTAYQGHKVWKMWREYARDRENVSPDDIELGLQSFPSTPTSLGASNHDEVIASTDPLANQVGEATEFNYIPELVQGPELQSTFPDLETPQLDDVVASTAPSAGHVGEAAGSGHTPVFIQGLELQSTPPSFETPQCQEVTTGTATSAGHADRSAVSKHTPTAVQGHELQSTLPTTVNAGTSLNPTLAQEAQIEENGVPKVPNINAQPALTDMEYWELRPVADDHH